MLNPEAIKYLILHTSDSEWGTVKDIDLWHKQRGWDMVGYHYVVTNQFPTYNSLKNHKSIDDYDGVVWRARPIDEVGSHCLNWNDKSLGICLIGKHGIYTTKQIDSVMQLLIRLNTRYLVSIANIIGHYETDTGKNQGKTCPDIQMDAMRLTLSATPLSAELDLDKLRDGLSQS